MYHVDCDHASCFYFLREIVCSQCDEGYSSLPEQDVGYHITTRLDVFKDVFLAIGQIGDHALQVLARVCCANCKQFVKTVCNSLVYHDVLCCPTVSLGFHG